MSISLPTYTRREMPLLGRRHRLRAIIVTGLRREFKRPAVIVSTLLGVALIVIISTAILLFAALLGLFSWTIALQAIGLAVLLGSLFTAFYTSVTLLLSSLTHRKSYAAAGIFAVTFGLTIPAEILSISISNPALLYASPWEDYLAVARAAFG